MARTVTLAILLLAGCLKNPVEVAAVSIPAAPVTLDAVYDFRAGGRSAAR